MLIDSNIIVYAINSKSPKNKIAKEYLEKNSGKLEIAHQNIFESLRVLTHKAFSFPMSLNQALNRVDAIADSCRIISPNNSTFFLSVKFIKTYNLTSNHIFDAYLAATALSNQVNTIVTDNEKDFRKIKEIKTFNPFTNSKLKN